MAQNEMMMTIIWASIGCGVAIGIGIAAVVCWFLAKWLRRVPAEHRRLEPGRVWFLLIPVFGAIWNFFVYPPMAESFDAYFRSRQEPAPSARGLALWYSWLVLLIIPISGAQIALNPIYRGEAPTSPSPPLLALQLAGGLLSLVVLVLWVVLLVRFHELQKRIPAAAP